MRWLGVNEGHHELSHNPDSDEKSQKSSPRSTSGICEQLAYLAKRLAETPEPGGEGSLLDNTLIVWTNELGKGNSHTLDDIPFVLVGNGLDFKMGRSLKYQESCRTTGCCCRWPTASATTSSSSATRTSAEMERCHCLERRLAMATVHDAETVPYVPRLESRGTRTAQSSGSRLARLLGNRGRRARAARDARGASKSE